MKNAFLRTVIIIIIIIVVVVVVVIKGIQDSFGFWIQVPYSGLCQWISIVSGIPDSLSCIPDSKAQDSGLHKQNFLGFRIP